MVSSVIYYRDAVVKVKMAFTTILTCAERLLFTYSDKWAYHYRYVPVKSIF